MECVSRVSVSFPGSGETKTNRDYREGLEPRRNENMAASTTETEVHGLVKNMLYRVANSDAVVKSQQRGEPDLTVDEKVTILLGILDRSPSSFLMRFGKYLVEDDLRNFHHLEGDYEIDFRLKEVKNILDTKKKKTGVRNRRFECLQRLMKDSDYFSEEQMRKRSPLLYEEYIGQYLSEEEKFERDKAEMGNDPTLSELLMSRQEKQMDDWYLEYQRDQQTSIEEENESDSDSSIEKGNCSVLICVVCLLCNINKYYRTKVNLPYFSVGRTQIPFFQVHSVTE